MGRLPGSSEVSAAPKNPIVATIGHAGCSGRSGGRRDTIMRSSIAQRSPPRRTGCVDPDTLRHIPCPWGERRRDSSGHDHATPHRSRDRGGVRAHPRRPARDGIPRRQRGADGSRGGRRRPDGARHGRPHRANRSVGGCHRPRRRDPDRRRREVSRAGSFGHARAPAAGGRERQRRDQSVPAALPRQRRHHGARDGGIARQPDRPRQARARRARRPGHRRGGTPGSRRSKRRRRRATT
jgi:hypothetical protein